ncbi:hypothetical protein K9L05_00445 [Candidatus Babeliales bacterium]|nr:hypothetical protein [Candidatus Babeliales bacterium]MCF7899103.1 hypothetical protein [Candidatus Babeliales bacterium]
MKRLNKLFLATILGFFAISSDVAWGMEQVSNIAVDEELAAQKQKHLDVLVNLAQKIKILKMRQETQRILAQIEKKDVSRTFLGINKKTALPVFEVATALALGLTPGVPDFIFYTRFFASLGLGVDGARRLAREACNKFRRK